MGQDGKLDALFAEYRGAFPDPEGGADFMPSLWQKIEARRMETAWMFRRLVGICVVATVAVTLLINTALIQSTDDKDTFYSGNYIDILAADYADDYSRVLPVGDLQ